MKKLFKLFDWKFIDIIKVILGSFIFCLAVNIFIVSNHLYNGGVLGLSQLIRSLLSSFFDINRDISGIIYYVLNIPILIIAYREIGKTFFARTLFAISLQSIMLFLIPIIPILDDTLACVLVGGILCGLGIGILLSCGASTGGTDIIGLVITKRHSDFSVGKLSLIVNTSIYLIAGIMYGLPIMIYSIIYSVLNSLMLDKMHNQNICSTAFIFCKKNPRKINNYIKNNLKRDFTYWDAKGGYDNSKTYIIYTALTKYELIKLEHFLNDFDDHVFIVKSEGVGIKGKFEKKF